MKKTKIETEATEEKKTNPKGELVKETLTFDLTEHEIANKGKEAAEMSEDLAEEKAKLKALQSKHKGKINLIQADLDKTLQCIMQGTEEREVECTKVVTKDDDCEFWYKGKMMKDRPATDQDRQSKLPVVLRRKPKPFNGMVIDKKMAAAGPDAA